MNLIRTGKDREKNQMVDKRNLKEKGKRDKK
jgi:hypothetical protein